VHCRQDLNDPPTARWVVFGEQASGLRV